MTDDFKTNIVYLLISMSKHEKNINLVRVRVSIKSFDNPFSGALSNTQIGFREDDSIRQK